MFISNAQFSGIGVWHQVHLNMSVHKIYVHIVRFVYKSCVASFCLNCDL